MRKIAILLILALVLPFAGCVKKTTLDKIGGLTVAGVKSYILQLDGLKAEGVITAAKHQELTDQAKAIEKRAEEFRDKIATYAEIRPGDVRAIVTIAGDLIGLIDTSLRDEAIVKLPADALALKILRGLRIGVNQAQIVLTGLFPAPTAGVQSQGVTIGQQAISTKKIVIVLQ